MNLYLDSNIFVYAFLEEGKPGKQCRELLKIVREGNEDGVTSALSFNEGVHVIRKFSGFDESLVFAESLLSMPHLNLREMDGRVLSQASDLMKRYKLSSGDAIHIATAIESKSDVVYSQDADFKKVKEIKLRTL